MNEDVNTFIEKNFNKLLETATNITNKNGTNDDPNELLNYSILQLLENKKKDEIIKSGFAFFWIVRVMTNSIYSQSSDFHRNIRPIIYSPLEDNYMDDIPYHIEKENLIQAIETIMVDIEKQDITGWYVVNIFKIWTEKRSISKVSVETNIPRNSIHRAITTCRKLIIEELKKRNITYDIQF